MSNRDPTQSDLRTAIRKACQPQNAHRILAGRQLVLEMPRAFVIQSFETLASDCLDLTDDWEYRRLLELAEKLDQNLLQRIVQIGMTSDNEDVREAANDFRVE